MLWGIPFFALLLPPGGGSERTEAMFPSPYRRQQSWGGRGRGALPGAQGGPAGCRALGQLLGGRCPGMPPGRPWRLQGLPRPLPPFAPGDRGGTVVGAGRAARVRGAGGVGFIIFERVEQKLLAFPPALPCPFRLLALLRLLLPSAVGDTECHHRH